MTSYSAVKNKQTNKTKQNKKQLHIMKFADKWMELEKKITLSEGNPKPKDKNSISVYTHL